MATFTDGTHNLLFRLDPDKWRADLEKSAAASLTGYQEAEGKPQRITLKDWCAANGRGLYHPKSCGNPISWDSDVWEEWSPTDKKFRGCKHSHLSAVAMGVNAKMNPARDFVWLGLRHKATQRTVLRINVHPLAGGTRAPGVEEDKDSPALDAYKNWGITQYWLDIVSFAAREMSRNPDQKSRERVWGSVLLGGDYNGDLILQKSDEWYYPSRILPSLFVTDKQVNGLDHLQHAHGSDVVAGKRWKVDGFTDHRIHFQEREFKTVPDSPGT